MFDAAQAKDLSNSLRARLAPWRNAKRSVTENGDANELNAQGWRLIHSGKSRAPELAFKEALQQNSEHLAAANGLGNANASCQRHVGEHRTIYLDYNSTAPISDDVVASMNECFAAGYLNPAEPAPRRAAGSPAIGGMAL